jgi:hypothetical protein
MKECSQHTFLKVLLCRRCLDSLCNVQHEATFSIIHSVRPEPGRSAATKPEFTVRTAETPTFTSFIFLDLKSLHRHHCAHDIMPETVLDAVHEAVLLQQPFYVADYHT